jgi:hypothetical protein
MPCVQSPLNSDDLPDGRPAAAFHPHAARLCHLVGELQLAGDVEDESSEAASDADEAQIRNADFAWGEFHDQGDNVEK